MLDNEPTGGPATDDTSGQATDTPTTRRRAPRRTKPSTDPVTDSPDSLGTPPDASSAESPGLPAGDLPATGRPAPRKRVRKAVAKATEPTQGEAADRIELPAVEPVSELSEPVSKPVSKAPARKRAAAKKATSNQLPSAGTPAADTGPFGTSSDGPSPDGISSDGASAAAEETAVPPKATRRRKVAAPVFEAVPEAPADSDEEEVTAPLSLIAPAALFVAPQPVAAPAPRARARRGAAQISELVSDPSIAEPAIPLNLAEESELDPETESAEEDGEAGERRRRRRGRRGRGRGRGTEDGSEERPGEADLGVQDTAGDQDSSEDARNSDARNSDARNAESEDGTEEESGGGTSRRRRRRRRRSSGGEGDLPEDLPNTVVRVREPRVGPDRDEVQGVKGSTRLEAKRQRRRDGRDQGRRRPPVLSEAEFLARREAVERVMAVRQVGERTQIAVLEDDVLVEHYVTKASNTSYAGNVYLGKVQNVLPSMEAAFVDIGKGRNAVLYAGEVNWDAAGMDGKPRKIELAMKSGDPVLVQVTKDPIGHKGARLTSQISLPGRFLVYVPEGQMTGISRKLPDTERKRLKDILKRIIPENAGVIIRTAAEGASEEELTRDVARLEAQWQTIKAKAEKGQAPSLLYGEPDLVIRVIRDIFNEDFAKLVVSGDEAWEIVQQYVEHVSPDLVERLSKHAAETDLFASLRVDEQLAKALDRKVWLPSGGSLVIDRTEAMTVVDVNTGKFVGQGGNLEETVTRNNLEAAEEIVRQLRLRDVGGIIVIDFIDMVLEGNRDLVLRRLTECLGRDRTKHQVAEVTSLGLVQMTRKRVGQGLLEAFSDTCEHCKGRGVMVYSEPIDRSRQQIPRPTPKPAPPAPSVPGAGRPESVATEVAELAESGVAEVEEPAEGRSRRRRGRGRGAVSTEGAVSAAGIVSAEGAALAESPAPAQGAFSNGDGVLGESGVPAPNVRTGKTGFGEDDEVPAPSTADHAGSSVVESFAEQAGLLAPEPLEIEAPARQRRRAASRPAGPPVTVG